MLLGLQGGNTAVTTNNNAIINANSNYQGKGVSYQGPRGVVMCQAVVRGMQRRHSKRHPALVHSQVRTKIVDPAALLLQRVIRGFFGNKVRSL
jgi:hypothetical protein